MVKKGGGRESASGCETTRECGVALLGEDRIKSFSKAKKKRRNPKETCIGTRQETVHKMNQQILKTLKDG